MFFFNNIFTLFSYIFIFYIVYLSILIIPKYISKDININSLKNLINIKSDITADSIQDIIKQIDLYLFDDKKKNVNIYIHSNGGDYDAGFTFIQYINSKKKSNITFSCYAKFAASTAFTIFQYCDHRYVMYSSILFQHELKITAIGSIESIDEWYLIKFKETKNRYIRIKKYISKKTKLDYLEYEKKVKEGWILIGGILIIYNNLADQMIKWME